VDGTWHLRIIELRAGSRVDVSSRFVINWSLTVRGESSSYVAIHEIPAGLTVPGGEWRTFSLEVTARRTANDLMVVVGSDNFLAFRHELEVLPPGESAAPFTVVTCRPDQSPAAGRCLKVDMSGRTIRIPLPRPTPMAGTWTVRWRPIHDPAGAAAANSGGTVEVIGDCPESAHLGGSGLVRGDAGMSLHRHDITLHRLRLGLSETRLTPELLANRVLDEAEQRPFSQTHFTGIESVRYNFERVRTNRDFWSAHARGERIAQDFMAGRRPSFASLATSIGDGLEEANLRRFEATGTLSLRPGTLMAFSCHLVATSGRFSVAWTVLPYWSSSRSARSSAASTMSKAGS
jgi:hypothetical protein